LLVAIIAFGLLPGELGWVTALLGWWLLLLALLDLEELRLPDALTLPLIVAGILLSIWAPTASLELPADPLFSIIGAIVGYLALAAIARLYRMLRNREGLGLGDAKLFAAGGAWLGVMRLPDYLLLAALLGVAHAIFIGAWRQPDRVVPFGPALALAFWLTWLSAVRQPVFP
jgi:leader peptidase (prepilin peptidase) / N-methyltransferase